ncbi:MAG: DegV family protein [Chloroflexi bacterium]|nr:DegV family protein [Chloroflexota bacterium]
MAVKIVTDSTSDLPRDVVETLGITVVPAYVHFGDKTYRDGVDIKVDELYRSLVEGPVHPTTAACSPGDFAVVYDKLAKESDEIVAITVTGRMSAMYKSALLGRDMLRGKCRIEVVDSESLSMGLGLITMAAARKAQSGGTVEEVLATVRHAIPRTQVLAVLDTLKYALRGGRLSKASRLLGILIKVKPVITVRHGEIVPAGVVRTRSRAIERLYEFVKKHLPVEDIAVAHNTTPQEAEGLAGRLKSLIPGKQPTIATVGPALGVHAGPGALVVALMEGERETGKVVSEGKKERKLSLPSLRHRRQ